MIDALEKMPGIEIENSSNIKIQGKKVSQILVENKPFFGGSIKLAMENIPADALKKIQIIDNFNEVSMLKGVSGSEKLVINIKLRKDKKKFIFGDLKAGSAIASKEGYHKLNGSVFSYNGQTDMSFLASNNNIGERSFSYEDLSRFQNGTSDFVKQNSTKIKLSSLTSNNTALLENRSFFSAFSANFKLNDKTQVESFGIFSKAETINLQESKIEYLTTNTLENKEKRETNKDNILLGNIKIKRNNSRNSKLIYNGQFLLTTPKILIDLNSIVSRFKTTFEKEQNKNLKNIQ